MKKILAIVLAMVMVLSLVGCGGSKEVGATAKDMKGSVAMLLSGLITDEAFNQYTYEGMMRAAKEKGFKTAHKENVTQDEQVEVIRQFAQNGYSIVIGQGGQFGEALSTVAAEYPNTQFIFSVGTDTYELPNISAATVSYSHAGFIGGVLAGLTTKNKKVAMIVGEFYDNHHMLEAGFKAGVSYVNPDIQTHSVATGDWADTVKAREASLALVAQGYDVLFPCLDAAGAGVAAAALDSKGVHVVGSVADYAKAYGAADVITGSVVFAWENLGYLEASGILCDGKSHVVGMADKGIEPIINATLDADAKAIYDKALTDLAAGKINIVN